MSASGAFTSSTLPADILAVAPGAVVGSRVVIDPSTETQTRLQRVKDRLYVVAQLGGWGSFVMLQLFFGRIFAEGEKKISSFEFCGIIMTCAIGLLLTHAARPLMARWGWRELSWRALLPRLPVMALALSVIWSAVGYGYIYGVLQHPWPAKVHPLAIITFSVVNGVILLAGWLFIYFFYHVFDRLQRMQVEQLRMAASVKEAELRALKSQVNPHFLFNSLNSLRALIDEDAPRARESVTRLANMLRYSLQSGQQEMVPFEEEIRIVEDYLALEQIRHEERLRVRWDVPAEVRLVNVPPMLLQTLVENAVKYGISPRREGGEIGIVARFEGAALSIRVSNPGDLAAPASPAAARAGSSTGVGLRNASERLKLLFGGRATLTLLAEPAGFVTADIVIPLNPPAR